MADLITSLGDNRLSQASVVATYYNPSRYVMMPLRYQRWLNTLGPIAAHVRCYEMVLDDDAPQVVNSVVLRGTRASNLLWQKEALINVGLRQAGSGCKYFAFLDCDLVQTDPSWITKAFDLIDAGMFGVQLLSTFNYLDNADEVVRVAPGPFRAGWRILQPRGIPGGSWMVSAPIMRDIGKLADFHVVGGGDATWFDGVRGSIGGINGLYSDALRIAAYEWCDLAWSKIGTMPSTSLSTPALHLYHGDPARRRYTTRNLLYRQHGFDPSSDLSLSNNGLLAWTDPESSMAKAVAAYFAERMEDD